MSQSLSKEQRMALPATTKIWIKHLCRSKNWKNVFISIVCVMGVFILTLTVYRDYDDNFDHNESEYRHRQRMQEGQICIHPQLEINHSSVVQFFHEMDNMTCSKDKNWVYVDNGTFRITEGTKERRGKILCDYFPFYRGKDDFETIEGPHINPMDDGTPIHSDFFKVSCISQDNHTYVNVHSGIAYNADAHARGAQVPLPAGAMGLSVLVLGFDSVSRMTWLRKLPQTHSYFTKMLKGIVLEGYNIVGDGTPQALLPILTGKTEMELPEARRGKVNATVVDKHPWIWKEFKKLGYVTQFAEDEPGIGTFTYRMLGFKEKPVDHYLRPFYLMAEKMYSSFKPYCLGSMPRHVSFLNWLKETFRMYGNKRKFMFGFYSECSHSDSNKLQYVDGDVKNFLRFLEENGYLDKTILIMMSDHGARFNNIRESVQGKLEERMPYFAFRFPTWFEKKYPLAISNLRKNVHRLTTPFDIYETLQDILDYKEAKTGDVSQRGISLFKEIPKERSCAHADVAPHWCACQTWEMIDNNDDNGATAVRETLNFINGVLEPFSEKCANLNIQSITRILKYSINGDVLRFRKSSDVDGRVPDLSSKMAPSETLYQVTFRTEPGSGHFEATVRHSADKSVFTVNGNEISRINKYGDDPACVQGEYPHLRPYCYCRRVQL